MSLRHNDSKHGTPRTRGRTWQRIRLQVLAEEPLCRACQAADRVTAAAEVDHIKPLHHGGTDERSNLQQLRANMSDGPFHRLYKAVLRLVAEAPAPTGITTREIGRRCRPWNQATKKTQDDCLSALMRDGYIVARDRESASGRGRAGAAYFMNTVDGVDIVSTGGVDG